METNVGTAPDRLNARDFERLAQFIHQYSGIRMPPTKKTMVEGRLRRRVRALGLSSLDDYCRKLFDGHLLESETVCLIDAVTTNKTEFFREPEHFRLLVERALPDLMAKPHRPGRDRPLKVWSAASSIGAEPYTLAMVLEEYRASVRGFRHSILATDICTEVLAKAKVAIYPREMMAPVPTELRRRYFMRARESARATVRIVPEIRQAVRFGRLNLMDEDYPLEEDFDVIFCRNILIYFDKATQLAVVSRLCDHLRPGGYLFVGHTETLAGMDLPLRQAATAVFVRI